MELDNEIVCANIAKFGECIQELSTKALGTDEYDFDK